MSSSLEKVSEAFKADGAIGKEFTENGSIGGTAQQLGGPFDKDGMIGKQFTETGAIGGNVQNLAEKGSRDDKGKNL